MWAGLRIKSRVSPLVLEWRRVVHEHAAYEIRGNGTIAPLTNPTPESAILARVVDPQAGRWPPEAAAAVLSLALPENDRDAMNALAAKSTAGTLTPDEELTLESYRQVCRRIDLLQARAHASLAQAGRIST